MRSRIGPIAGKEFRHILRDWRSLAMVLALPLIMVLLFGYAITFDINDIRLAVHDADRSPQSRALLDSFTSSGYFRIIGYAPSEEDLGHFIDHGWAQIALSIPVNYGRNLLENGTSSVAVIVDGTAPNNANIASGYVDAILAGQRVAYGLDLMQTLGVTQPPKLPPINLTPRFWYNSEMRSQNYIVPGLIATIMMVMTALLTSLTIVRERERGSLELLLATPVRTYEIMVGKVLPYFCIGLFDAAMVAVVGMIAFRIPFAGNVLLFLAGTSLFAFAGLGVGLFISTVAGNQVVAMQMAILSSMLPSFILSGFMFPIRSMPDWVQVITYLATAKYYLIIARGIFLKDAGIDILWPQFLFLAVFAAVALAGSVKKFRKKIG